MDVDDLWTRKDGKPSARAGKGKRWRARWRSPDGKQHGKAYARKIDAERFLATQATDQLRGSYIDPDAGRILLRDYTARWQAAQTAGPRTRETTDSRIANQILPQLGDLELRAITPSTVGAWWRGRARELSDGYARGCRVTLSAILTAAVEDKLITANPCLASSAKPPRRSGGVRVVPWSQETVLAVAEAIGADLRSLVLTGAGAGLRQGELLGLAVEDIDFLRRIIHVRRQLTTVAGQLVFKLPKGEKTRDVPLAETLGLALAAHLENKPTGAVSLPWGTPDGKHRRARLFWTRQGAPWRARRFNGQVWEPALASVKGSFSPGDGDGCHALRHYAASSWLFHGCSIRDVAEFLGHADPGFTLRVYGHLMPAAPDRMRAAADAALTRSPIRDSQGITSSPGR